MKIAIVTNDYYPKQSSAAIQLKDLVKSLIAQGCDPIVIVPGGLSQKKDWALEKIDEVNVLRLRSPDTSKKNFFWRTLDELLMPLFMIYGYYRSPYKECKFNGLIWYSPSIFLSIFIAFARKKSECKSYLILRDIFPKWAVDLGIINKKSISYYFLKFIEGIQFKVADRIGIQSIGNLPFVDIADVKLREKIEVLHNWLAPHPVVTCSISISETVLSGRYIFVYAGNMGIAQGLDILVELAASLVHREDIGFLFVGRGSYTERLRGMVLQRQLANVLIFDQIDSTEIPGLYAQCHIGIISLDSRHQTHNIPGKFLSYMQSGLPVLAVINPDNDLEGMILHNLVGKVCTSNSVDDVRYMAEELITEISNNSSISNNCINLANKYFLPKTAAKQIIKSLNS